MQPRREQAMPLQASYAGLTKRGKTESHAYRCERERIRMHVHARGKRKEEERTSRAAKFRQRDNAPWYATLQ